MLQILPFKIFNAEPFTADSLTTQDKENFAPLREHWQKEISCKAHFIGKEQGPDNVTAISKKSGRGRMPCPGGWDLTKCQSVLSLSDFQIHRPTDVE
jgi:hypothetical protein